MGQTNGSSPRVRFWRRRRSGDHPRVGVNDGHPAFKKLLEVYRALRAKADVRLARLNPTVDKMQGITSKWRTAATLAQLSNIVYKIKDQTENETQADCRKWIADAELRVQHIFPPDGRDAKADNAALVVVSSASIFLVFKGTLASSKCNWYQNSYAERRTFPESSGDGVGKVHSGFYEAQDGLWKSLMALQNSLFYNVLNLGSRDSRVRNLYIAGHSVGGAMAIITAVRLVSERAVKRIDGVYTFGSPALFDPYAAERYSEHPVLVGRTFRVKYKGDSAMRSLAKSRFLHPGVSIRLRERDGMTVPARIRYDAYYGPRGPRLGPNKPDKMRETYLATLHLMAYRAETVARRETRATTTEQRNGKEVAKGYRKYANERMELPSFPPRRRSFPPRFSVPSRSPPSIRNEDPIA